MGLGRRKKDRYQSRLDLAMVMFSPANTSVSTVGDCREEERGMYSESFVVFISLCC